MSQSPNYVGAPEEQQPDASAFAQYKYLMASGHFKPATSISLAPPPPPAPVPRLDSPIHLSPPARTYGPACATPTQPAYSPIGAYASPRGTPTPPAFASSPYTSHYTAPSLAPTPAPQNTMSHSTYGAFPGAQGYAPPSPLLLTPDSITRDMLAARVQSMLRHTLPEFNMSQNVMLSMSLINRIIHQGQNGALGPRGLQKLDDIFMVIGHDGLKKYMALAVMAPVSLCVLLRGTSEDLQGKEPLVDVACMEWLRQGFYNVAVDEWNSLNWNMKGGRK